MAINKFISVKEIKKIFSNTNEKKLYLKLLYNKKNIDKEIPKFKSQIDEEIINTWDFTEANNIIRQMFKDTKKYEVGKYSSNNIRKMIKEWKDLGLGELNWPFSATEFDQYIQRINKMDISEEEKDEIVKIGAIKFRRIKKINTARNDFIEYLIVEHNSNVTPTLKHSRGIDFYIDGYPFDQKVSRSVTRQFINDYGPNWKKHAIKHPEEVGRYLYKFQDEARFGDEPRLLIVYLENDISDEDVYKCVTKANLKKPYHFSFEYKHSTGIIKHEVDCYIILLHKQ